MSDSVRAFISVSLGGEVRSALSAILQQIEAAGAPGVRLMRAESIHLTLKFLGDTSSSRVDAVKAAVGQAVRDEQPFSSRRRSPERLRTTLHDAWILRQVCYTGPS